MVDGGKVGNIRWLAAQKIPKNELISVLNGQLQENLRIRILWG